MPRPEIIDWVEENTGITECSFYASMSAGAYGAAIGSAFSGQFWLTGGLALVGRAAELTAEAVGCNAQPPPVSPSAGQCWKTDSGAYFQYTANGGWTGPGDPVYLEILSQEVYVASSDGRTKSKGQVLNTAGNIQNYNWTHTDPSDTQVRLTGAPCSGEAPDPDPTHNPGDPIADPVTHTDSEGCNWTIQATDAYVDASGVWHTYYTITADNDACGGPFAYWSSGGEPKFVTDPGNDPDGNPYSPPPPEDYKPDFDNIEDKIDKIKEELDAVKDCACGDPKPELLGDWVSIRFVSDGISPGGTNPLRKLFRYRSQSSRTIDQLRDYWAGFTWQAGPVVVQHKGTWWGTPQIWASSVEEGKRVLRFAAGEAGATPDTDGEWIVTGSASARYGMPGTMRIQQYRGADWITGRDGPSGPVEL